MIRVIRIFAAWSVLAVYFKVAGLRALGIDYGATSISRYSMHRPSQRAQTGTTLTSNLQRFSFDGGRRSTALQSSFLDNFSGRFREQFGGQKKEEKKKTESQRMLEYVDYKPWRATKVKHLKIHYKRWKDAWQERYRTEDDDTIYYYACNKNYFGDREATRIDNIWRWPWLWTKIKSERMSWVYKLFLNDVTSTSVQEHMELDNFFSEFDMPRRWGLIRLKEIEVLFLGFMYTVAFTDLNHIAPTDLGVRPDGTLKTCAVQFHNCISTSNSPLDTDHYAPPFKWVRSKSPEQALDELKTVFREYPVRGLRWKNGWIDRGGWFPQLFSATYFYATSNSLAWEFTDDTELVFDAEKREVQYRSSTRLMQVDWDVERQRYNQFARMLSAKGSGWIVTPLEKLEFQQRTPYRWTQLLLDKGYSAVTRSADSLVRSVEQLSSSSTGSIETTSTGGAVAVVVEEIEQAAGDLLREARSFVLPYVQPVINSVGEYFDDVVRFDPRVAAAVQTVQDLERTVERWLQSAVGDGAIRERDGGDQGLQDELREKLQTYLDRLGSFVKEINTVPPPSVRPKPLLSPSEDTDSSSRVSPLSYTPTATPTTLTATTTASSTRSAASNSATGTSVGTDITDVGTSMSAESDVKSLSAAVKPLSIGGVDTKDSSTSGGVSGTTTTTTSASTTASTTAAEAERTERDSAENGGVVGSASSDARTPNIPAVDQEQKKELQMGHDRSTATVKGEALTAGGGSKGYVRIDAEDRALQQLLLLQQKDRSTDDISTTSSSLSPTSSIYYPSLSSAVHHIYDVEAQAEGKRPNTQPVMMASSTASKGVERGGGVEGVVAAGVPLHAAPHPSSNVVEQLLESMQKPVPSVRSYAPSLTSSASLSASASSSSLPSHRSEPTTVGSRQPNTLHAPNKGEMNGEESQSSLDQFTKRYGQTNDVMSSSPAAELTQMDARTRSLLAVLNDDASLVSSEGEFQRLAFRNIEYSHGSSRGLGPSMYLSAQDSANSLQKQPISRVGSMLSSDDRHLNSDLAGREREGNEAAAGVAVVAPTAPSTGDIRQGEQRDFREGGKREGMLIKGEMKRGAGGEEGLAKDGLSVRSRGIRDKRLLFTVQQIEEQEQLAAQHIQERMFSLYPSPSSSFSSFSSPFSLKDRKSSVFTTSSSSSDTDGSTNTAGRRGLSASPAVLRGQQQQEKEEKEESAGATTARANSREGSMPAWTRARTEALGEMFNQHRPRMGTTSSTSSSRNDVNSRQRG